MSKTNNMLIIIMVILSSMAAQVEIECIATRN